MNSFILLEKSKTGADFSERLKENIQKGCCYSWLLKIDQLLNNIPEQEELLTKKFAPIKNVHQLFDKLAELLVAYEYLDLKPVFNSDSISGPDLFLNKTLEFVEVKRLNNSDSQNSILESLLRSSATRTATNEGDDSGQVAAVNKKLKDHIDKALLQMGKNKGKIVVLYSLDLLGYINSLDNREADFLQYGKRYVASLNTKDIEFHFVRTNDLFSCKV